MRRRYRADPAQPALYSLILLVLGSSVHGCLKKKTRRQTRPEFMRAFRIGTYCTCTPLRFVACEY